MTDAAGWGPATLQWLPLLDGAALWLAVALLVGSAVLSLLGAIRTSGPRATALFLLRIVALVLLTILMLGPTRVERRARSTRVPFVVLIDTSRSMVIADGGSPRIDRAAAWIRDAAPSIAALGAELDVMWLAADGRATPLPAAASGSLPAPTEPRTDLGPALLGLRDALAGRRPEAVVLISDGADRGALGRTFAERGEAGLKEALVSLPAPISVVTVGALGALADQRVDLQNPPPIAFVRRPLRFDVEVKQRGFEGTSVEVQLLEDGKALSQERVSLDGDGRGTASFVVRPDDPGPRTFSFVVPLREGDAVPSNNQIDTTVKVVRDRTRVLQITSRPSWDVKFLRGLLKADPNIDLVSFFIMRNDLRMGTLTRNAELSLIPFPAEELFSTDLPGFDLVVLQNFAFANLPEMPSDLYLENVARYVREGGALLLIGGDSSFGVVDLASSALAPVLPTEVPRVGPKEGRFQPWPTEAGLRHPITSGGLGVEAARARWSSLPPFTHHNPLGALAQGATPLLTAGDGGAPLLVAQSQGRGRVLAFAADGSWRWALSAQGAEGGGDHAAFYRSAIRWLVRDLEEQQVAIWTVRDNIRVGETIEAQVRVLDESYQPRAQTEVILTLRSSRGGDPIVLPGKTGPDGIFAAQVGATRPGTWWLDATAPALPEAARTGRARVSVLDREPELDDPEPRPALLQALASATGGAVLTRADLRDAPRRPSPPAKGEEQRLHAWWTHPLLLALIAGALVAEWWLRRRWGLR